MSIQQNFPEISPSLNLNFARSKTLDPRITFTRTSTATRVNGQGLIEVVSADTPRFDHKYENGVVKSLGLLIEEQRENLTQNGDSLSEYSNTRVSNNTISTGGPFGTGYHEKTVTENGSNYNFHSVNQISITSGQTITFSIFFKNIDIDNNQIYLRFWTGDGRAWTTQRQVRYNLENLTTSISTGTIVNSSIQALPDGWYRLSMTATADQDGTAAESVLVSGLVGQKYQIIGAQVEQGSFPTSYIPTSGSTATRTTDNVSMVGHNFSGWYNQSEGTVYADTRMVGVQTGRYDRLWAITNSNLNFEGISLYVSGIIGSTYRSSITITNSATEQVGGALVETALTTPQLKSAFAFKQNNCASSYNGQQRFVDNIVDLSTFTTPPDRLLIGQPQRFQGYSCMTVSQLTYYPRRLTNTQLQNLTK